MLGPLWPIRVIVGIQVLAMTTVHFLACIFLILRTVLTSLICLIQSKKTSVFNMTGKYSNGKTYTVKLGEKVGGRRPVHFYSFIVSWKSNGISKLIEQIMSD